MASLRHRSTPAAPDASAEDRDLATPLLRRLRRLHRSIGFPAIDFLLPTACFLCHRPLGALQREGACSSCWASIRPLGARRACPRCATPATTDRLPSRSSRCPACVRRPVSFEHAIAAVLYDPPARRLLARVKWHARRELLAPLSEQLAAALRADPRLDPAALVTPVPSRRWNDLARGFSTSRELAREVARRVGLEWRPRLLRRAPFDLAPVKTFVGRDRPAAASRSYRGGAAPPPGRAVLLIDDVMTTGASLEACARILRRAGSGPVSGAFWARVAASNRCPAGDDCLTSW